MERSLGSKFCLEFLKWKETLLVSYSKLSAYRLNFFLQVFAPFLVFFLIKYSLWNSIYRETAVGRKIEMESLRISGFSFDEMIRYHFWIFFISLSGRGANSHDLAEEIRMGKISSYLIYPFSFWKFHTAQFFGQQSVQILSALVCLFFAYLLTLNLDLTHFFSGIVYTFFLGLVWFFLQFIIGCLAFWLEETWILRVILMNLSAFLSGAIIPLSFFPEYMLRFLQFTPFPYLSYYPAKIFMGEIDSLFTVFGGLFAWSIVIFLLASFTFNLGLRKYSGAGM